MFLCLVQFSPEQVFCARKQMWPTEQVLIEGLGPEIFWSPWFVSIISIRCLNLSMQNFVRTWSCDPQNTPHQGQATIKPHSQRIWLPCDGIFKVSAVCWRNGVGQAWCLHPDQEQAEEFELHGWINGKPMPYAFQLRWWPWARTLQRNDQNVARKGKQVCFLAPVHNMYKTWHVQASCGKFNSSVFQKPSTTWVPRLSGTSRKGWSGGSSSPSKPWASDRVTMK